MDSAGDNEGVDIATDPAPCGCCGKNKDPAQENTTAPKSVGQRRRHENAGRKGQRVSVYRPGELLNRCVQICSNDWKGIGDDEVIEGSHKHGNGQRNDDEPCGVGAGFFCLLGLFHGKVRFV